MAGKSAIQKTLDALSADILQRETELQVRRDVLDAFAKLAQKPARPAKAKPSQKRGLPQAKDPESVGNTV